MDLKTYVKRVGIMRSVGAGFYPAQSKREGIKPSPTMMPSSRTWMGKDLQVVAIVAVAMSTMFIRSWEGDLYRDEALYAELAKGILAKGEWLTLFLGEDVYLRKPPLMFWLVALSFTLFGVSIFSAKLVSILFGIGSCIVLYHLARSLYGSSIGFLSAIVLTTTPHYVKNAQTLRLDSGLLFFLLLALHLYHLGFRKERPLLFVAGGASIGMAFLFKGFFGLAYLPIIVAVMLLSGKSSTLRSPYFVGSLLVAALLILPWPLYQYALRGQEFLQVFLFQEGVSRLKGELRWGKEWWIYFATIGRYYWPWLPFLLGGFYLIGKELWQGGRKHLFVAVWVVAYFAEVMLIGNKVDRYLIPLYPAFAIASALAIDHFLAVRIKERLPSFTLALSALASILLLLLPIPLHSQKVEKLKALKPFVEAAPEPLLAYRIPSWSDRGQVRFYLGRDLKNIEDAGRLQEKRPDQLILTTSDKRGELERLNLVVIFDNGKYALLK